MRHQLIPKLSMRFYALALAWIFADPPKNAAAVFGLILGRKKREHLESLNHVSWWSPWGLGVAWWSTGRVHAATLQPRKNECCNPATP